MSAPANDNDHPNGYFTAQCRCIACKHEWTAVQVYNHDGNQGDLECPSCGCHRGQYKYPFGIEADRPVYICLTCGGFTFILTHTSALCLGCGKYHTDY